MDEPDEDGEEGAWKLSYAGSDELATVQEDWALVLSMLPTGWAEKAYELGAVKRQLRGFDGIGSMLRVLFIHLANGCSLRESAVRASAGGVSAVSDVALLKRLRNCGPWFEWMVQQLASDIALPRAAGPLSTSRRIRLIDGTSVSEPGATGSDWRLHYALDLRTLSCDEVHITEASVGESIVHFDVQPGDLIMADRGYAKRAGLRHVVERGADFLIRASLHNLPLRDLDGKALDLLPRLRKLTIGAADSWPAVVSDEKGSFPVRVCAYKKSLAQALKSKRDIEQEAGRKSRQVKPGTLEMAGYVLVVTTLVETPAAEVLELYRRRWQIELAFKRLKSLLGLGHLKKTDNSAARAWLQGKVLVACLIEKLILTAERFSPWGYEACGSPELETPLPLA